MVRRLCQPRPELVEHFRPLVVGEHKEGRNKLPSSNPGPAKAVVKWLAVTIKLDNMGQLHGSTSMRF